MKHRISRTIRRTAALLLALTVSTGAMTLGGTTLAKYVWDETTATFYISYSHGVENTPGALASYTDLPPGYYAFYITGGGGGKNTSGGNGGAGGYVSGVVRVNPGQTLTFTAGAGGGSGSQGIVLQRNYARGGEYSALYVSGTLVAVAGGGGGGSDDNSSNTGGAGGGLAALNGTASSTANWKYQSGSPGSDGAGSTNLSGSGGGDPSGGGPEQTRPRSDFGTGDGFGIGGGGWGRGGHGGHSGIYDGAGGGGSSAYNTAYVVAAAPTTITGLAAAGGAAGTSGSGGAGEGRFYYLGPILPGDLPPFNNFVTVS